MSSPNDPDPIHAWGKWFYLFAWLGVLVFGTWAFQKMLKQQQNPNQQVQTIHTQAGVKKVVLDRNRYGHYVVNGWINGQLVELMVDTGASDVSIPESLAKTLHLSSGAPSTYITANGPITAYRTRIDKMQIGDIVLHNVRASINPAVDDITVLVGMSFLKQIEFTQKGNQLILAQ